MGIFQRMKQAREMRKVKLEEHKAKKRANQDVDAHESDASEQQQPSPTNSVDEQNAPDVAPMDPEPMEAVAVVPDAPVAAEEPTDLSPTSAGLLCGCI